MIVWDDIEKLTNSYNSGLKKIDGVNANDKLNKKKTNFNSNAFSHHYHTDDYGLDDKITIKPIHVKYDASFKNLMSGKTTPSHSLGKVQLSSGTIEAIKLGKQAIPNNIDYSYTDPQYYEHKLEGKTNKDMILKNLSKSEEFARGVSTGITLPKPSDIPPAPSTPSKKYDIDDFFSEIENDTKQKMANVGLGGIKPTTTTHIPHRNSVFEKPKTLHIGSAIEGGGGGGGQTEKHTSQAPIKKLNQTQEARVVAEQMPLSPNDINEGIETINDLIESFKDIKPTDKIDDITRDRLNEKVSKFGFVKPFRSSTSIGLVKSKLNDMRGKIDEQKITQKVATFNTTPKNSSIPINNQNIKSPEFKSLLGKDT